MIRRTFIGSSLPILTALPFLSRPASGAPRPKSSGSEPDIDLFVGFLKDTSPRRIYGALDVYDLLTRCTGDPLRPSRKGAVLTEINTVSYASLAPLTSTETARLGVVQNVLYITSGYGTIHSKGSTYDIRQGIGIIIPPLIPFTIANTGNNPLTLFIIEEPLRKGFIPARNIIVKNDFDLPVSTNARRADYRFWLFSRRDGLSTITGMDQVEFLPKSSVPPHVHLPGEEEIWITLDDTMIQFGGQQRFLPANSAYKVPANGRTPHTNINESDSPIRLLWIMKAQETRQNQTPKMEKKDMPDDVI